MDGSVVIREAIEADLPAIVHLLADDFLGATREQDVHPLPAAYTTAFAAMRAQGGNTLLVAERGGRVVGCVQLTLIPGLSRVGSTRAQLEGVRVAADERGQRIGEQLIEAALTRAAAAGCSLVQLTTDRQRVHAQRFYERLGFVATHVGMKRELPGP